jgi:Tfp pilus assembly protein FimT
MRDERGVTIVEMFVVLSIMAFLVAISIPLVSTLIVDTKSRGAAEQVVEALRGARQSAIATTSTYRVSFANGRIVVDCQDDPNLASDCPANRPPRTDDPVLHGATVVAAPAAVDFSRLGAATAATITVTYPDASTWQVVVNVPGRVRSCKTACT